MPKNVVITPLSGLVDFYDAASNLDAKIQIDDSGSLNITNTGGTLSLGNTAANVYIGDGTNSVDLIFEQNGAIRALTGKTLTLGNSASNIAVQSPITINSPILNTSTTGYFEVRQTVSTWTNSTSHPIIKWDYNATYDDHLYLASGGNAGGTTQTALVVSETSGILIGKANATPNATSVLSTTPVTINASTGNITTIGSIFSSGTGYRIGFATDAGGSLNLGRIDNVASSPYIDFNSGATTVDYDVRLQAGGGNGTAGNGTLTLTGNFSVTGNLTVNGTTTTVNSTTVTVDDPIFTLGGDTAPASDDNKDRGIEFRWHNGTTSKVGFFGFDDSTGYFTFIADATNTSEVFSGTQGDIQATNFRGALIGNSSTATAWQTARTLTVGGTGKSVDGSANVSWSLTEIGVPSLTGTGASGTWGISITGNAATVSNITRTSSSADLDTLTTSGFYRVQNTNANLPAGFTYGQLLTVYGGSDTIGQLYFDYATGYTASRAGNPTSIGGVGSWSAWRTNLNSTNYSSYALPLTGGTLTGSRPITFDTTGGDIEIKGDSGGWATGLYFVGSSNTNRGGFGALGSGDTLTNFWVGPAYNNTWMTWSSSAVTSNVDLQLGGNYLRFDQSGVRSWNIRATGGNLDIASGDGNGLLRYNSGTILTSNTSGVIITRTATSTNSTDFNTITTSGTYQVGGNGTWTGSTNGPTSAYAYGLLEVFTDGANVVTQRYVTHSSSETWIRSKFNASDWQAWRLLLTSANYNSYSPTLTGGGASGTWSINVTGNAGTVAGLSVHTGRNNEANKVVRTDSNGYLLTGYINSNSGDENNASNPPRVWGTNGSDSYLRTYQTSSLSVGYATSAGSAVALNSSNAYSIGNLNNNNWYEYNDNNRDAGAAMYYPNAAARSFRYFFANASTVGTGGNYAGVLQFNPWSGTTASTGDASYQLAFGSTAANGGGNPQLRLRKGIDTTWNSWIDVLTSANYNSYSPTLTGTGASGTWGINVTGSAGSVAWTNVSGRPTAVSSFTNDSGYITSSSLPSTAFDGVGSYIWAISVLTSDVGAGGTIAGSNLRYNYTNSSSAGTSLVSGTQVATTSSVGGGTALSGTWRLMSSGNTYQAGTGSGCCAVPAYYWPGLYVRIS